MLTLLYVLKKTMNKILTYTLIAILLGTFTMVTPLAVLKPSSHTRAGNDSVTGTEPNAETLDREDTSTSPVEPRPSLKEKETLNSLPSIGLMVLPGFLVGLGGFMYIKKRME